jgi:hypothetical protein
MLQIDLYTEITCPWCIIGQHRLDKVLAECFPGLAADIRHHPVLLMPDAPAAGLYIPDLLHTRYGVTDPKAAFARPEAEASVSGLELDLGRQLWAYPMQAAPLRRQRLVQWRILPTPVRTRLVDVEAHEDQLRLVASWPTAPLARLLVKGRLLKKINWRRSLVSSHISQAEVRDEIISCCVRVVLSNAAEACRYLFLHVKARIG